MGKNKVSYIESGVPITFLGRTIEEITGNAGL